jgi:DNA-binding HxlR family transcriptional regulator
MESVQKDTLQQLAIESEFRRTHRNLQSRYLNVDFAECPVEASLGVLGKKWTIQIIRDIGVYDRDRFSLLLKSLPSIPPKILATRLKQLELQGFLMKYVEKSVPPMIVRWSLTEKGLDAIRIGMMLAAFGSKWNADTVFDDKRPRRMHEILNQEGMELLVKDF